MHQIELYFHLLIHASINIWTFLVFHFIAGVSSTIAVAMATGS